MPNDSQYQRIFDEWPDEDPLLPYDEFFVGGSSDSERPGAAPKSFASQLIDVRTVQDLLNPKAAAVVPVRDDRSEFVTDQVDLLESEQYGELFFRIKRQVFEVFDFLTIKSAALGDVPMQERELVMDSDDYYVIEYLQDITTDYFKVAQVAMLTAHANMGITHARFCPRDTCALCAAHSDLHYGVNEVLELLGSGGDVTHPYCECMWSPVIRREHYSGPLEGHLDRDSTVGEIELKNVPLEILREVEEEEVVELPYKTINFVNMVDHMLNEVEGVEDSSGVVVLKDKDVLYIHNSYVGVHGPLYFLREFHRAQVLLPHIDPEAGAEIYYVGGRASVKKDGKFWDAETGECLS